RAQRGRKGGRVSRPHTIPRSERHAFNCQFLRSLGLNSAPKPSKWILFLSALLSVQQLSTNLFQMPTKFCPDKNHRRMWPLGVWLLGVAHLQAEIGFSFPADLRKIILP